MERSRDSDSSEGESDSNSSVDGSSSASSLSSPINGSKNVLPLHGIDEIAVDQRELTVRLLSRLRDLWELSNGYVCLSDHYIPPAPVSQSMRIDDFAEGLGIKLDEVDEKDLEESADDVKKVIGETGVKRSKILKELIDTEETYIRGLQELVEVGHLYSGLKFRFTLTTLFLHCHHQMTSGSSSVMSKQSSTSMKISSYPPSFKPLNRHPLLMIRTPFHKPVMLSARSLKKKPIS